MQDALSTAFIDARTLGIETWPILGLQTWEGKVVEVDGDFIAAELTPMNGKGARTILRTDFRTDSLDLGDHVLVAGDLFYMTSRKVRVRGRLSTSYSLQIRRPGNWTEADLAEIRARTQARIEMLNENAE